jgi:hypothetical protein
MKIENKQVKTILDDRPDTTRQLIKGHLGYAPIPALYWSIKITP